MEIVREKRKEKGLTQQDVAKAIGLSRISVNKIEQGKCKPKLSNAKKLGELLGFDFVEIYR